MNTPVSFEIAKLLKEKGYNFYHRMSYWKSELTDHTPGYALEDGTTSQDNYLDFERYYAPTIAEVVMWLYEKHGVWLHATMSFKEFSPYIQCDWNYRQDNIKDVLEFMKQMYNSPTEAYTAAIEYTLTKLIK